MLYANFATDVFLKMLSVSQLVDIEPYSLMLLIVLQPFSVISKETLNGHKYPIRSGFAVKVQEAGAWGLKCLSTSTTQLKTTSH